MNVHVWHGSADQCLTEALAKELATQCRGTFHSLPDKGHATAWFLCWKQIINEHVPIKADESRLLAVKQAKEAKSASRDCVAAQLQCYPLSLPVFTLPDTIFVSISIERALFVPPLPPAIPPSAIQVAAAAAAHSHHPSANAKPEDIDVRRKQQQLYVCQRLPQLALVCHFLILKTCSLCQNGDDFGSSATAAAQRDVGGAFEHGTASARATFTGCRRSRRFFG